MNLITSDSHLNKIIYQFCFLLFMVATLVRLLTPLPYTVRSINLSIFLRSKAVWHIEFVIKFCTNDFFLFGIVANRQLIVCIDFKLTKLILVKQVVLRTTDQNIRTHSVDLSVIRPFKLKWQLLFRLFLSKPNTYLSFNNFNYQTNKIHNIIFHFLDPFTTFFFLIINWIILLIII